MGGRRLKAMIDIGADDDDVLVAVFLPPHFLSLAPCRLIVCQHEIPMLDDVEHLTGAARRQWTGPLPSHAAATPNRAVLMAADNAASAKSRDCDNVRSSYGRRNETRSLS
jgi:hypothetical protein